MTQETIDVAVQTVFFGTGPAGGGDASFITGLQSQDQAFNAARVFNVSPTATEKIYYAFPSSFGTPTFLVEGDEGGFFKTASAVDVSGIAYDLYESDNLDLGPTKVRVDP